MIGMFESDTQIYSLTERYLFIPAGGSKINWLTHPQTRVSQKLLPPHKFQLIVFILLVCPSPAIKSFFTSISLSFSFQERCERFYDHSKNACGNEEFNGVLQQDRCKFYRISDARCWNGRTRLWMSSKNGMVSTSHSFTMARLQMSKRPNECEFSFFRCLHNQVKDYFEIDVV